MASSSSSSLEDQDPEIEPLSSFVEYEPETDHGFSSSLPVSPIVPARCVVPVMLIALFEDQDPEIEPLPSFVEYDPETDHGFSSSFLWYFFGMQRFKFNPFDDQEPEIFPRPSFVE